MILVVCIFWLHVWANYLGLKIGYPIPLLDLFPFQWPRGEYPILPRSGGWGCLRSALIFRKFRKSGSKKIRFASETYGNWWYLITTVNFAPFASHSTAPLLHCWGERCTVFVWWEGCDLSWWLLQRGVLLQEPTTTAGNSENSRLNGRVIHTPHGSYSLHFWPKVQVTEKMRLKLS